LQPSIFAAKGFASLESLLIKGLFTLFTTIFSACIQAQNIYTVDIAKAQPLVYRDADGSYKGCGIRVVFITDVPTKNHLGDISMNLYLNKKGEPFGLSKAIYSVSKDMSKETTTNMPISSYSMAGSNGKGIKMLDLRSSNANDGALLANNSWGDAIDILMDFYGSEPTQIGFVFKNEKVERIFALRVSAMSKDERAIFMACMKSLTEKANQIDKSKKL
jgi:hypothetical protein